MRAVLKKELRQYIATPIGSVFIAAYFAIVGYYVMVGLLLPASSDISGLFYSVFSVLTVLVPLLTMRSFAEERRMRTEPLLLTSPESVLHIAMGKFLAAYLVFLCGSLSFLPPLLLVGRCGALEPMETVGNLIALLLVGGAYIAIGLFASAITESQVVAAVVSYAIMLGLWLLDYLRYYAADGLLSDVVSYLSFRTHFSTLSSGIFSLSTLVYFASLTVLMFALTCMAVEHRREK